MSDDPWDEQDPDLAEDVDELPEDEPPDEPPEMYYPDIESFLRDLLLPSYRRSVASNSTAWCPEWWRHEEAIARIEALWRAWEHLRLEPALGISVWFRDHADHHMAILLSEDGPFRGCSPDKGHSGRLAMLPVTAAPAGMFS